VSSSIPLYGIDAWVSTPIISLVISLLLICGLDFLGSKFLDVITSDSHSKDYVIRSQGVPVGAMLVALFAYPATLLHIYSLIAIRCSAIIISLLGLINILSGLRLNRIQIYFFPQKQLTMVRERPLAILSIVIITCLFLISIGPVTNADSLDYHMGVPIAILNEGGMPFIPEWFNGRLAGNGEVLNAIALSIGAEQFGSVLQWASLLAISAMIFIKDPKDSSNGTYADLLLVASVSSPVLLFLVSAPKPQMWPVALTTFAFYLFTASDTESLGMPALKKRFLLVCVLCMCASQAKLNYLLGGAAAGSVALFFMLRKGHLISSLLITISAATLIMFPAIYWKSSVSGSSFFQAITQPLPGNFAGTAEASQYWSQASDFTSSFPFPISILIPDSFGVISLTLGIGWLVFFLVKPRLTPRFIVGFIAIFVVTVVNALMAPHSARVYLEPYYWGLVLCAASPPINNPIAQKYIAYPVIVQATSTFVLAIVGVAILLPGAMAESWRKTILLKSANGYEVMTWVDEKLPKNAVFLNSHRSMALAPRKAVNFFQWKEYVEMRPPTADYYLQRVKSLMPSHILVLGDKYDELPLYGCFGDIYAGPGTGRLATRNPFNKGEPYQAWLFNFNWQALPQCAYNENHTQKIFKTDVIE
jgi:hypothetical protein